MIKIEVDESKVSIDELDNLIDALVELKIDKFLEKRMCPDCGSKIGSESIHGEQSNGHPVDVASYWCENKHCSWAYTDI